MVLGASLLNSQNYKVRVKGKVEQYKEWSSALPLHFSVVAIENGAFGSPSTKVANFTYFYFLSEYLVPKLEPKQGALAEYLLDTHQLDMS